ncbi:hypothetical protein DBR32_01225 [Taibaiella sp. KBW10]|uniref:T9SS type B sorting domain-containing protein n=1 Tax=Taibaiella sp. KBW10 TaxID=2153357 RepID=UPI000F5ACED9|nr:gliding motility-associated C-terminal domain-containing protein [Taibaiella sp. KBW10]RQO32259.1 hypothetical protein DBR32_01225 [Taibaiella sp. KBW10]
MKKLFFSLTLLLISIVAYCQPVCNGYWGQYLVNQTFGTGNATDTWYGPLATYAPGASTSTTFVGVAGPPGGSLSDGYSGLAKNPNVSGQGANWISKTDHTGNTNGLMLLVNAPSTAATVFFEYTMNDLCPNTTLKLSVWVLNVNSGLVLTSTCGASTQYPNITLRVVDPVTNAIISTSNTGNVPLDSAWHEYSIVFSNAANPSVKLQLINNSVGSGCGNDLALDDITVQPCVPISQVLPKLDTLTCSNTNVNMHANVINSPYNPAEYQWQYSNDGGVTWINAGAASPSPNYTFSTNGMALGQYLIRYLTGGTGTTANSNCIGISDTSKIYIDSIPKVFLYETICSGTTFDFYGRILNTTGIYDTIIAATGRTCDTLVTLDLTVAQSPGQILMHDTIIACQYDTVALESNTLPYSNNYTYNWYPATNLNSTTDPNVWFVADLSRSYVLTVTNTVNNVSCNLSDTVNVIVNPGDFLQVPIIDSGICPGDTIQLSASGASTYHWSPELYLSDAHIANPVARTEVSTVYTLIGTSNKGCTDTQVVDITVHPAAVLELPDFVNLYPGETYYMQPGTNATYFQWFPNSGLSNNLISNPMVKPEVDTRYFVTARTEYGCSVTDSVDFLVKETVLDMPNAFNPNNAQFKVSIRGLAALETFAVYNRWGQKVFETSDIYRGWDGTFKGTAQAAGVYVYQIMAITHEGKRFSKTGNVTLVR